METMISRNNMRSLFIMQVILDKRGTISNMTPRFKARMSGDSRQWRLPAKRAIIESRRVKDTLRGKEVVQDKRILGKSRSS